MSAVHLKTSGMSRSTLVTAAMAGGAILYVFLIFLPTQRAISKVRREVLEKQEHILQSDRLAMPLQQTQCKMQAVETFTSRYNSMLPSTQGELLRTFGRISEQAKLSGVIVRRFDPKGTVELASLREANLEISLDGNFAQIMDFLARIEQLPHLIWITDVKIGRLEGSESTLLAELTLTIFGDLDDQAE